MHGTTGRVIVSRVLERLLTSVGHRTLDPPPIDSSTTFPISIKRYHCSISDNLLEHNLPRPVTVHKYKKLLNGDRLGYQYSVDAANESRPDLQACKVTKESGLFINFQARDWSRTS
jgi:hypothetical protein